jgi:membrane protein required for colicin V production
MTMLAASTVHDLVDWITHMNWVDFLILVVMVYSVLTGAWLGFMSECVSLAGVALGVLVAGITYNGAGSLLGHIGVPKDARDWVGFVTVFVLISLVFRVGALFGRKLSRTMAKGWSNNVVGGLFGILVGGIICLFAIVTVAYFEVGPFVDPVHNSKIATQSSNWLGTFVGLLPKEMRHSPPNSPVTW